MILRRMADALRRQEWLTVFIESALIILGVLIALQVDNWNEARQSQRGAIGALQRLHDEVTANIAAIDDRLDVMENTRDVRTQAFAVIGACDPTPEASETVIAAAWSLTGDIIPSFVDSAAQGLSRRDQFLDLMSNDFRNALNMYSGRLLDERAQLETNFGLMWETHVVGHSALGIFLDDGTMESPDLTLEVPLTDVCEDTDFRRRLSMTEIWHQSTALRLERFKGHSQDFLAIIDQQKEALQ